MYFNKNIKTNNINKINIAFNDLLKKCKTFLTKTRIQKMTIVFVC